MAIYDSNTTSMSYTNFNPIYGIGSRAGSHTHSISPSWDVIAMPKEKPMSTLDKIKQQRLEEKERGRIEAMYAAYDASPMNADIPDGTVVSFSWSNDDKTYRYAAIHNEERWWVTGRYGPNGVGYEDLIPWLIEKDIYPDDITWYES